MIDDWWVKVTVLSSSFSCLASVLGPLIFYIGINLMKDIDSLRQQLSSFNIKRCKCYCCSVSHQDPVTKMRIPCDREVIFATLEEWYGGPKDPEAGENHRQDLVPALVPIPLLAPSTSWSGTTWLASSERLWRTFPANYGMACAWWW